MTRLLRLFLVLAFPTVLPTVLPTALEAQSARQSSPAAPAPAVETTLYEISFPNSEQREAEIEVRFRALPHGPLRVRMARSSPGRYALHEFAKNVYSVRATDADGRALDVTRDSPHSWIVTGHTGDVRFSYTLFADRADGTYSGVDLTRAHLNMPATFAWAPALATRPIQITFVSPDPTWTIATQLEPTSDARTFRAPNLQYFLDSPTHLGALDLREWRVTSGERTQTIRLALNHQGTAEEASRFESLTRRVVHEMGAVFGELPAFDFGTYTFIACYRATCVGDGMEHRNSTSLTSSSSLATAMMDLLGTVSHELFHAWNVERIRPASLEPFDFTEANMSGELWLAEGFTSYYGPLVIARAGIMPPRDHARRLSGAVNTLTNSPARAFAGAVGMSQQAPFVDAAVSIDPTNRSNTFISYYTYGEALGLALDLTLRARTPRVTLDDYMRALWQEFGRAQNVDLAPVRGYTIADAERVLATVSGDAAFARDFFARYVIGSELPDFPALLARAGLLVQQANPNGAWLGDNLLGVQGDGLLVVGSTTIGSPMHAIGLSARDHLLTIDGAALGSVEAYHAALAAKRPGDEIVLTWRGRTGERRATVRLLADPRVEVRAFEEAGRTPTAEQLAFRESWLKSAHR